MSVITLFLLSGLGFAMTVQAQDCSRPVGGPNVDLIDTDINLQSFPDGTKVTFSCNVGYRTAGGSPTITCTAGSWSPLGLNCEIKLCGSAGEVENGNVDYPNGAEFGDKAVVTCRKGYRLVGKGELTCGDQGWLGRLPTCEVVTCYPSSVVTGITFSPSKEYYTYREVIKFTCQNDLRLNGSDTLICSEDGTFKPDPPTCVRVECQAPDSSVRNTEWSSGSRPPYRYKATVTLRCKTGYIMNGSATVICEINSQWSPQPPVCERSIVHVSTTKPPARMTTTKSPSPPTTKDPTSGGTDKGQTLGIVFGVLICVAVLTCCGCYCFGVPECIKKKTGYRRNNTDKEAPHDGEDVALS